MSIPQISIEFSYAKADGATGSHLLTVHEDATDERAAPVYDINHVDGHILANNNRFSFDYSGRHDHGPLPQLKHEPELGKLISSIHRAKKLSDEFLSQLISTIKADEKNAENMEANLHEHDMEDVNEANEKDEAMADSELAGVAPANEI
jgi:hypothetical protein